MNAETRVKWYNHKLYQQRTRQTVRGIIALFEEREQLLALGATLDEKGRLHLPGADRKTKSHAATITPELLAKQVIASVQPLIDRLNNVN